jgi:hypothetical protein
MFKLGWCSLLFTIVACATPERRSLATLASLAHHEHLRQYEAECRLKQSGVNTFEFNCKGVAPVVVRCSISGSEECCWVVDNSPSQEDRKCGERRVATSPYHPPH